MTTLFNLLNNPPTPEPESNGVVFIEKPPHLKDNCLFCEDNDSTQIATMHIDGLDVQPMIRCCTSSDCMSGASKMAQQNINDYAKYLNRNPENE